MNAKKKMQRKMEIRIDEIIKLTEWNSLLIESNRKTKFLHGFDGFFLQVIIFV